MAREVIEPLLEPLDEDERGIDEVFFQAVDGLERGALVGDGQLGGGRRRGRAAIRDEVGDREIGLVPDA